MFSRGGARGVVLAPGAGRGAAGRAELAAAAAAASGDASRGSDGGRRVLREGARRWAGPGRAGPAGQRGAGLTLPAAAGRGVGRGVCNGAAASGAAFPGARGCRCPVRAWRGCGGIRGAGRAPQRRPAASGREETGWAAGVGVNGGEPRTACPTRDPSLSVLVGAVDFYSGWGFIKRIFYSFSSVCDAVTYPYWCSP